MSQSNGASAKVVMDKFGNRVILPATPTGENVRVVRRGSTPIKTRNRGTSYLPGGPHRNIYYWPGFKENTPLATLPVTETVLRPFGKTIDQPWEHFSKLVEPPIEPRRKFEFPGTRQRIGPPPVEPGRNKPPKFTRKVLEVTQEVPEGALGFTGPIGVGQHDIVLSDGEVVSQEQVVEQVAAVKASMPAAEAAKIDWGAAVVNAIGIYTDRYRQGIETRTDVIDKSVLAPGTSAGTDLKPILYAAGIGIAGFFLFRKLVGAFG